MRDVVHRGRERDQLAQLVGTAAVNDTHAERIEHGR
jgi:hypothetical protein